MLVVRRHEVILVAGEGVNQPESTEPRTWGIVTFRVGTSFARRPFPWPQRLAEPRHVAMSHAILRNLLGDSAAP